MASFNIENYFYIKKEKKNYSLVIIDFFFQNCIRWFVTFFNFDNPSSLEIARIKLTLLRHVSFKTTISGFLYIFKFRNSIEARDRKN